ncbi:MAG: hypothetical protein CME64_11205 [Halobacteriovoraceae bacterium]|nr:hypothetical protein [Halobacteriovoraceae bacterium]|tara:strand:+ start:167917 stop:168321 length:405 start_codon:yes stop_codon:yes gene_type:complete
MKKLFILLLSLLTSLSSISAEIADVYGYAQYEGAAYLHPNSALVLYADGSFELLRKYSEEDKTSIQVGEYTITSGEITLSVQDASCEIELEIGALGDFTLNYSAQKVFLENVITYNKKEESFLNEFTPKNAGCL